MPPALSTGTWSTLDLTVSRATNTGLSRLSVFRSTFSTGIKARGVQAGGSLLYHAVTLSPIGVPGTEALDQHPVLQETRAPEGQSPGHVDRSHREAAGASRERGTLGGTSQSAGSEEKVSGVRGGHNGPACCVNPGLP